MIEHMIVFIIFEDFRMFITAPILKRYIKHRCPNRTQCCIRICNLIARYNPHIVIIRRIRYKACTKDILILKEELYQIISDKSCKSIEQIRQDADRDHWMTAAEALEYGMIDKVYTKKA